MIARGDICWASLPAPWRRRPVLVVTRDTALPHLTSIVCVPITTRIRGTLAEVALPDHVRLPQTSVVNCDNLRSINVDDLDPERVGALDLESLRALDAALVFALGIDARLSA